MPVALQDLCRARRRFEAEALARNSLELGIGCRVCADRARELAYAHPLECAREAVPVTVKLERPAGELQPERGGLRVHAVGTAHLQRRAVLLCARNDDCQRAVHSVEDESAGLADLQRERRVDDVG